MSEEIEEKKVLAKIKRNATRLGCGIACPVIKLLLIFKKASPVQKAMISAALAYFVLPIDAIPDFIPGAGYADDLAILIATLKKLSALVDDEVKKKAGEKLMTSLKLKCDC